MTFNTLSDDDSKELYRQSRFYWREVRGCEKAGAYLAGWVVLGSALEADLMQMVNMFAEEAESTDKLPTRKGKPKPLLDWDLGELLRVAKAAKWLPTSDYPNHNYHLRKAKILPVPGAFSTPCGASCVSILCTEREQNVARTAKALNADQTNHRYRPCE
jgi:hypothetical protein